MKNSELWWEDKLQAIQKFQVVVKIFACTTICVLATPQSAKAGTFCMQPLAPTVFLSKPFKPYCANTRTCSQFEVDIYKNSVEDYFKKLKRFAQELDTYYTDTSEYIKCMADIG